MLEGAVEQGISLLIGQEFPEAHMGFRRAEAANTLTEVLLSPVHGELSGEGVMISLP